MGRLAQGRLGYVSFTPSGGSAAKIPVYDWAITARRNRVTGDPVGNTFSTNYADGMQTSRFVARVMVRKTTSEALTADFIQKFLTRTVTDGVDDTTPFTIVASDGAALHTLTGAKPESFVLTVQKGAPVTLSIVFVSPFGPTRSNGRAANIAAAYGNIVNNAKLLMYNDVTFFSAASPAGLSAGTQVNDFYSVEITHSNNHIVNAPLDGTLYAASFDAGVVKAGASFTTKAHNRGASDLVPFATESAIRARLKTGATSKIDFDLSVVVPETDDDGNANLGASYATWQCLVLGTSDGAGTTVNPVVATIS